MEILHLSDPHICSGGNNDVIRRLDYINEHCPKHQLVWTGDITNNGRLSEYVVAKELIKGFVVPGNHDVAELGNFDQRKRLEWFDRTFNTDFIKGRGVTGDERGLSMFGADSNPGTWGFFFDFARGKIGRKQLVSLNRWTGWKSYARLVATHHHPTMYHPLMCLSDSKKLMRILSLNCEILLCGHKHKQERITKAEKMYGIQVVHSAGALYKESEALEITIENGVITTQYIPII